MRLLTSLAIALQVALAGAAPVAAAVPDDLFSGEVASDTINVSRVKVAAGNAPPSTSNPATNAVRADPRPTGPVTVERYVYACPGNSYATTPATNTPCEATFQFCPTDQRQFYRYTTTILGIQAIPGPGPRWTLNGVLCLPTTTDPTDPTTPPVPVVTLADFQSLPLPAAVPAIQPTGGEALIRMRTNTYVDPTSTTPRTYDLTLLDTPVQVRATPTTYTWDYGDDTTPVTTTDPGAPYPDLTTWHTYTHTGTVQITLTTTYTGEYSVAGGPWQNIPGTAQITSTPQQLQLLRAVTYLTD